MENVDQIMSVYPLASFFEVCEQGRAFFCIFFESAYFNIEQIQKDQVEDMRKFYSDFGNA